MIRLRSTAQCWVRSCHLRPPRANMWPSISITHTALQEQLRNTGIPFHCSTLVTGTHLECFENGAVVFYTTDTSLLRFSLHKSLFLEGMGPGNKTGGQSGCIVSLLCIAHISNSDPFIFLVWPWEPVTFICFPGLMARSKTFKTNKCLFPTLCLPSIFRTTWHRMNAAFSNLFYSLYLLCLNRNIIQCKYLQILRNGVIII